MRSFTVVAVLISIVFASFAVAEPKNDRDKGDAARVQAVKQAPQVRPAQAPRPPQTQPAQVRPAHQSGGVPVRLSQPQYRDDRRRDDHRRNDHQGSFWLDILRTPVYPVYPQTYGGYVPVQPLGYGYATAYNIPCVVENRGNYVVVNRAYPVGTQLTVLGDWVTDPNPPYQPLYRRDQGTLVVSQSNGITSLCTVARGGADRGDEITIAQPAMDPTATGY